MANKKLLFGILTIIVAIAAGLTIGCIQPQTSEKHEHKTESQLPSAQSSHEINFTPKPGEYLHSRGKNTIHDCVSGDRESEILLIDSHLEYGKLMANQTAGPPICPITAKEGDPCVIIRGTIKNEYDRDYFICISADVFNSKGEKVGQIVDPPICAFSCAYLEANETGDFSLHVKYDREDIASYDLYAFICDVPPP